MPSVIIIDDEPVNLLVLRTMLEVFDAEVHQAGDPLTGLQMLGSRRFDLVLTDIQMPCMTGIELVRRVRGQGGPNAATVIIAVTADETLPPRELARHGVDGLIIKPIALKDVEAALQVRARRLVRPLAPRPDAGLG
jgi:CheY-like chemotaxis protein